MNMLIILFHAFTWATKVVRIVVSIHRKVINMVIAPVVFVICLIALNYLPQSAIRRGTMKNRRFRQRLTERVF